MFSLQHPGRLFTFTCCWCLSAAAAAASNPATVYTLKPSADLRALQIQACFSHPVHALRAQDQGAVDRLRGMHWQAQGAAHDTELRVNATRVVLPKAGPGCLNYRVELPAGAYPGAQLVDVQALFWWPRPASTTPAHARIILPPAATGADPTMRVSAPWPLVRREDHAYHYRPPPRPPAWGARLALGKLYQHTIEAPGGRLHLTVLPGRPPADYHAVSRWIRDGARIMSTLYGRLPVPDTQVLVIPGGRGDEPVPWGQVMRGGGDSVHLYIDQRRPLGEFLDDWTLAHELSHLFHPRIHWRDAWIYEGLASYYQNVLRARAGRLTPQEAWERLHAGFQRGIRGTPPNQTLAQVSENMRRNRLYMRVYWSGAAVALLADVELRRRSGGRQSLDTALAELSRCCLPADRLWGGREFMARLDTITGTDIFTSLYATHAGAKTFPDLAAVYRQLGLGEHDGGLWLDDDAPDSALRRAIMEAPAE